MARGGSARSRANQRVAYLYIAPALVVFLAFAGLPFLQTVQLSFFDWDGITQGTPTGLANYRTLLGDPLFASAFAHAAFLVLVFATVPIVCGLLIAAVFTRFPIRGATFFRATIYLPQVMSTVVVGVIWNWMYATDGPINQLLSAVGLDAVARPWLGDFTFALPAVAFIGAWMLIGLTMVLFVAGVQQLDTQLFDAAQVDGAGRIREFFTVTLPGLRYEIGVALTMTVVAGLKTFDIVFVLTRGGPGTQTLVPGLMLYNRAFGDGRVGQACAIAVILTVLVLGATVLIDRLASREA